MSRITKLDLEVIVGRINRAMGAPAEPYRQVDGRTVAAVGNYHISWQCGGAALHRMMNEGGGIHDVFSDGHGTTRELYDKMRAFLAGVDAEQRKNGGDV